MAAQELGGGVEHDIGAVLDGAAQIGRRHGIVDHQRHAGLVRNGRHLFDIEHVHARVGDGLAVERAGLRGDGLAEVFGIAGVDELDIDAQAAEAHVELGVGAAVERAGGHQLVALPHQARYGQKLRRLAAGCGQATDAAFERRHALLENIGGRVHDAGVDIPGLLEREQSGGVRGIVENIRRGLVDGHGARVAGFVGSVSGVQRACGKAHGAGGSGVFRHNSPP